MSRNPKLLVYGGAGLAAGTALSLAFPAADGIAGTALMLILCISSALCGASVPGLLKFDSKPIRATGATVFFVLPWLVPPSAAETATASGPAAGEPVLRSEPGGSKSSPEGSGKSGDGARPPIRIPPPSTTKPPAPPTPSPTKPALTRPRTVFDSIFVRKTE